MSKASSTTNPADATWIGTEVEVAMAGGFARATIVERTFFDPRKTSSASWGCPNEAVVTYRVV